MNSMGPLRFLTWRNAEGYRLGHARTSSGTKGSQGFLQMRPVRIELFDDIVQRTARAETLLITVIMPDAQFGKFPAEIAIAGVEIRQPQPFDHESEPFQLAHPAPHDGLVVLFHFPGLGIARQHRLERAAHRLEFTVGLFGDFPYQRKQLLGLRQRERARIVTGRNLVNLSCASHRLAPPAPSLSSNCANRTPKA